jgi:hypothetical protein
LISDREATERCLTVRALSARRRRGKEEYGDDAPFSFRGLFRLGFELFGPRMNFRGTHPIDRLERIKRRPLFFWGQAGSNILLHGSQRRDGRDLRLELLGMGFAHRSLHGGHRGLQRLLIRRIDAFRRSAARQGFKDERGHDDLRSSH